MKRLLCAFLCLTVLSAAFVTEALAEYVFPAPEVKQTGTIRSENDVEYSFSLACGDAREYEKRRVQVYDNFKDEYTDAELAAAGYGWLLYETVLLVRAKAGNVSAEVKDVSVFEDGFSLSLCGDILPALDKKGAYSHSSFDIKLSFAVALKSSDGFIDASPSCESGSLSCPATAKVTYGISEKAVNPNPTYIFTPFDDYTLLNPSLEGFTFAGWESDEGFVSFVPSNTADFYVAAHWDAKVYKINYVLTTRSGPFIYVDNTGNPKTREYGRETVIFDVNAPMGYVFGGWYENACFTGERVTSIEAERTGDILLFARWLTEEEAETEKLLAEHWGDLDDDGRISASDARIALRCAVGLDKLDGSVLARADFEGNGTLTALSARYLLRIAVGLDTIKDVLTFYGRI